jgi:FMN phosphatase YigB (HAD superfamily)
VTSVSRRFDAVTFDYWHTLIRAPDPEEAKGRRADWIAAVLRRFELEVEDVRLREAIDTIARSAHQNWVDNRQYYAPEASSELLRLLDVEAEAELLDAVIESFNGGDEPPVVEPAANVRMALTALRAAGVRVGIVCDVGMAPSSLLRRHLQTTGPSRTKWVCSSPRRRSSTTRWPGSASPIRHARHMWAICAAPMWPVPRRRA